MATTEQFLTGTGATPLGFTTEYLNESDIKVRVNGGNELTFTTSSTPTTGQYHIPTNGTTIKFGDNYGGTDVIHVYRKTDFDNPLVSFTAGSSIKAADLNLMHKGARFGAQENRQTIINQDLRDGSVTSDKIKDGTIVNADVNASAAIDGTKINPNFGSQNIATSGTVDGRDVSVDGTKLDTIETNAKDDQTAAEIKTLYESNANSNEFSDAEQTKLAGIETAATADQTAAEIRTLVDNATDSNVFTDADHTKLNSLGTLNALSDVDTTGVADNKILKYQASSSKFVIADDTGGGGGSSTFTGLSDSPTNYTEAAGKTVKVNAAGNGLEFVTVTTPTQDIVNDTTPQLGGNLDVQASEITTSTTNGNIKLTPDGTGKVEVKGNTNAGSIQLNCENNSHGVTLKGPAHINNANYTLTLPTAISAGKPLVTDVNGNLSWSTDFLTNSTSWSTFYNIGAFGGITLGSNDTIKFDSDDTDTNHISFKGPTSLSSTVTYTLPEDGTNGQFLKTNGSGVLSFADVSSTYNISINTLSSSSGSGGGSATFNGSATRFTLSNAGTNAQAHIVSVNGVIQKPNSGTSPSEGFAIDGNDIIFASAPASGSDFFILTLGNAINLSVPADDSVTQAKIADGAVSGAKIAQGGVTNSQILDDTISETKLNIHAAPSGTDKVLGYTANGMEWVVAEAGATGGGTDKIFYENGQTVTTNYTITNNTNAMSAGPVTINSGIAVTIGTGENWTIV